MDQGAGISSHRYATSRTSVRGGAVRHASRPSGFRVRSGSLPPYERWTKDALYHAAKAAGIEGRLQMNKTDLIEALRSL